MRISDWSSDVCSSDLTRQGRRRRSQSEGIAKSGGLGDAACLRRTGRVPFRADRNPTASAHLLDRLDPENAETGGNYCLDATGKSQSGGCQFRIVRNDDPQRRVLLAALCPQPVKGRREIVQVKRDPVRLMCFGRDRKSTRVNYSK